MTTADIIRRKASVSRAQPSDGTPGADRAFRFGLGKAARDALKIQLDVEKLLIERRSAAELVELLPDFVSYSPIFGQISGLFKLLPAPADRFQCC